MKRRYCRHTVVVFVDPALQAVTKFYIKLTKGKRRSWRLSDVPGVLMTVFLRRRRTSSTRRRRWHAPTGGRTWSWSWWWSWLLPSSCSSSCCSLQEWSRQMASRHHRLPNHQSNTFALAHTHRPTLYRNPKAHTLMLVHLKKKKKSPTRTQAPSSTISFQS